MKIQLYIKLATNRCQAWARVPYRLIQSEGVMHQSTLQFYMNWGQKKLMN